MQVVTSPAQLPQLLEYGFAVGAEVGSWTLTDFQNNAAGMSRANAKYTRILCASHIADPSKTGTYTWTNIDVQVAAAVNAGLTPHFLFTAALGSAPNVAVFTDFVTQAVTRYRTYCTTWEILNEINHWAFWGETPVNPAAYVTLLQSVYPAIKSLQPASTVITAGLQQINTAGGFGQSPVDFLTNIYAAGGKNYFDAVANHPYTLDTGVETSGSIVPSESSVAFTRDAQLYATMSANGDAGKKIWWTEFGYPTTAPNTTDYGWSITEAQQQTYLQTVFDIASKRSYLGPLFIYGFRDILTGDNSSSLNMMENNYGVVHDDYSPKPVVTWLTTYSGRTAPSAPSGLTASPALSSASLSWTAPSGGAKLKDYDVQFSTDGGSTWTLFNDGVSATTSTTVTGLTAGVSHLFRVRSVNQFGASAWSNTATATPSGTLSYATDFGATNGNLTDLLPFTTPNVTTYQKHVIDTGQARAATTAGQNGTFIPMSRYNTAAATDNMFVQGALGTIGQTDLISGLILRANSDTSTYVAVRTYYGQPYIETVISGVATTRASAAAGAVTMAAGQVWRFEASGTAYTLKVDGSTIVSWSDTGAVFTQGATQRYCGFSNTSYYATYHSPRWDAFACGDI